MTSADINLVHQKPRHVAIKVLSNILLKKGSLSTQLARHQSSVAIEHTPLLKELCFGVCHQYPKLNSIGLHLLAHPFEEKDTDLYALLLLGFYQLTYMNIPDHAAINESVEACRHLDKEWATKLINAVLRRYQREEREIIEQLIKMPSIEFNHPKWLVKRFKKHWPEQFERIITSSNSRAPMCIRVNDQQVSRETYINKLKERGIDCSKGLYSPSSLYLKEPVGINQLPFFQIGEVSIQDEAAQLSAHILSPENGDRVLDACAAPGGKTGHLLEVSPSIELTAVELESWRLEKIESNLDRLSYQANLICADASDLAAWWNKNPFDKILLDVPCSATGVIRRNPDIKINRKPADIEELVVIQKAILNNVWQTLKPDGYMLYATCSLLPEENELQIANFLTNQKDAREVPLDSLNGTLRSDWGVEVSHGKQLFPNESGHDGFYYCLLKKSLNK